MHYSKVNHRVCAICLNVIINPSKPDKCMHVFCFQCLNFWKEKKKNCPLCRMPFRSILDCDLEGNLIYKTKLVFNGEKNKIKLTPPSHKKIVNNICCICYSNILLSPTFVCSFCFTNSSHYECDKREGWSFGFYCCEKCRTLIKNKTFED